MKTEVTPIKVTFQVHRDLSDCRKPRYMVRVGKHVIADGRTLNEVRDRVYKKVSNFIEPDFVVMAE